MGQHSQFLRCFIQNSLCLFFGNFCHHYHQHYHHNYDCNHHYHHWYFFCHTRKTSFLTSEKEVQVARKRGRGNSGNARKKTFIFMWGLPFTVILRIHEFLGPCSCQYFADLQVPCPTRYLVGQHYLLTESLSLADFN